MKARSYCKLANNAPLATVIRSQIKFTKITFSKLHFRAFTQQTGFFPCCFFSNCRWGMTIFTLNADITLVKRGPLFSDWDWFFWTFILQINTSSDHNGCAERTSRLPQRLDKILLCFQMRRNICKIISMCPTSILKYVQNRPRFNSSMRR